MKIGKLLSAVGLITRSEHEALIYDRECQTVNALVEIEHLKAELRAADNLASGRLSSLSGREKGS